MMQHPTQELHKNFINFEKPQSLSKIPKVWSKDMKCMIKRKKESYQMKNKDLKTKKEVRKKKCLSFVCLGVREERDRKN